MACRNSYYIRLRKSRAHFLHLRRDCPIVFCQNVIARDPLPSGVRALDTPIFHQRLALHERFAVLLCDGWVDIEVEFVIWVLDPGLTILQDRQLCDLQRNRAIGCG